MMRSFTNIFWLTGKELKSLLTDVIMMVLILWSFGFSIMMEAGGAGDTVRNASIAIIDEDRSPLTRRVANALMQPWFQTPREMTADEAALAMERREIMFALSFPPDFAADTLKGRSPEAQLIADATAVSQAQLGTDYIRNIVQAESQLFLTGTLDAPPPRVALQVRRAFNPNSNPVWFKAMSSLLNQLSVLTIILTGAAMLREREHGTIEHLMVMPLTPVEVALSKVLATMLVVLTAFSASLILVVQGMLGVPLAGSIWLLIGGAAVYLWAASAIGILLGTLARSMAQFALLVILVIIPIMMLSGGMGGAVESQPDMVQRMTWFLPSRHFLAFAKAVAFRGAGVLTVWPQLLVMIGLGAVFFTASLLLFRRSMSTSG